MNKKIIYAVNSIFILLCLISLTGGIVYRFYSLNNIGVIISLILAFIFFIIIQYFSVSANKNILFNESSESAGEAPKARLNLKMFLLLFVYLFFLAACFYFLIKSQTISSLISPWQVVSGYFFIAYLGATLVLLLNIIFKNPLSLTLIILHYFLSFSVALIVYRLGYGYDPFIHQATESLIDKIGSVEPKQFYYLGQYSLVVILHKISGLPIVWLDRVLLPLLAALTLPFALKQFLDQWFNSRRIKLILILGLLSLAFPFLIVTTPQNLAYLLLIIAILKGLTCKNYFDFALLALFSLTAILIHPLAGLPALLFSILVFIYNRDEKKLKILYYSLAIILTIVILPALFYIINLNLPTASKTSLAALPLDLKPNLPGQENFIFNSVYLYAFNYGLYIFILAISGIFIAYKFRSHCRVFFLCLAMSISLFISYFLTSKLPFSFLINYERSDYADRIFFIACLFLLPFIILALYGFLEKIFIKNTIIKLNWAVFFVLAITASLYISYPRFDNYFNSRGYSVSGSDIEAVKWVNDDSKNDFIVLANQQVSAAALSQFGFKKYYTVVSEKNTLFYYPIPTSSPLYHYYLSMVYEQANRQTMLKAMDMAGVKVGYFILNSYWRGFKKIYDEAKYTAQSSKEFNGGVFVFKYVK